MNKIAYKRNEFDTSPLFPGKGFIRPPLPEIEFEESNHPGVAYKITDLRLLNENAVSVFLGLINYISEHPDAQGITIQFDERVDKCTLYAIADIVTGVNIEARKRGRSGWLWGGLFLVEGTKAEEKKKQIHFYFCKDRVKLIHDFITDHGGIKSDWSIYEMAVYIIDSLMGNGKAKENNHTTP